jgi:hypothetical protein
MIKLDVKRADTDTNQQITINGGEISVDGSEELAEIVEPYSDMDSMDGAEPPNEKDTPAEKFVPATEKQISDQLTGALRIKGYGVDVV